jgi:two-component system, NtrC family, response regulator PilR
MASILIVDDERSMRDFLKILLEKEGHRVNTVESGDKALAFLGSQSVDVVVSDIRMPGMSGIELLEAAKRQSPELPIIMITAFASPDDAVLAMKNGAYDYITKPFNLDEIKAVITSATSKPTLSPLARPRRRLSRDHRAQSRDAQNF